MTGATARLFHSRVLRESGSAAEDPSPTSTTAIFAADSSCDFVDLEKDEAVERETAEYACEDDGFLVGDRVYNKQYAHLYYQRLANLSPRIAAKVRAAWPGLPLKKILEVEPGLECAVIGTLYKDMKLKPSVLDDYAKNKSLQPHLAGTKFVSGDDTLVLEDEGARMKLQGSSLRPEDFVSGVCVAVRGVEEEGGHFEVKDVCFAGPGPQTPLPPPPPQQQQQQGSGDDKFLCLVSGLNLGAPTQDSLPLQLLVDYVTGGLGDPRSDRVARRIARMVVAGNVVAEIPEVPIAEDKAEASKANKAMREADIFLTQIASSMPLDIMPGQSLPPSVRRTRRTLPSPQPPRQSLDDSSLTPTPPNWSLPKARATPRTRVCLSSPCTGAFCPRPRATPTSVALRIPTPFPSTV